MNKNIEKYKIKSDINIDGWCFLYPHKGNTNHCRTINKNQKILHYFSLGEKVVQFGSCTIVWDFSDTLFNLTEYNREIKSNSLTKSLYV